MQAARACWIKQTHCECDPSLLPRLLAHSFGVGLPFFGWQSFRKRSTHKHTNTRTHKHTNTQTHNYTNAQQSNTHKHIAVCEKALVSDEAVNQDYSTALKGQKEAVRVWWWCSGRLFVHLVGWFVGAWLVNRGCHPIESEPVLQ
jgi:hypothetical protein